MVITRNDISIGYQSVQSTHSVADFASVYKKEFDYWKEISNSIICLSVKDEHELLKLFDKYREYTPCILFREPDIDNQATSICLFGTPEIRKTLRNLPLLGKENKYSYKNVINRMIMTQQNNKQNILEHGLSVMKYFNEIKKTLKNSTEYNSFLNLKIPDFIIDNKDFILENLLSDDILNEYQQYHDIGKPYCIKYDEEGKIHFPNHEEYSSKIYLEFSDHCEKLLISKLIYHDMDFHKLKPSECDSYLNQSKLSKSEIISLLLTTLAELNSNADMFGGFESTSFKIKYKNYLKISKKIIENLK